MTPQEQRLYWVWAAMVQRCHNPRNKGYRNYGAKGVRVCERWRDSSAFMADMGVPPAGLTLERIDSKGNYEPTNCRWATRKEQSSNRPDFCRYYVIDGERITLKEAVARYGHPSISYRAVVKRIERGWIIHDALSQPTHPTKGGIVQRRAA